MNVHIVEKFLLKSQKIKYICANCKKEHILVFARFEESFLKYCPYCKGKEKRRKTNLEKYGDKNYNNREKYKQTCLEKYGVDSTNKLSSVLDKKKKTFLDRFGVENPMQSDDVKRKIRDTCLRKYGTESFFQSDEFKHKSEKTQVEKYGDHFSKTAAFKEKSQQTCLKRYGAKHQCVLRNNVEILYEKDYKKYLVYIDEKYGKNYLSQFKKAKK